MHFVVGGTSAACFTDREGELICDHGAVKGRSAEISAGIRRFLLEQDGFTPYVQVGLGVRLVSYSGDDVFGLAVAASAGAGVRARVHELLSIAGGAALEAGAGIFDEGLGGEPQLGLTVHGGVEFLLD